MEIAVLESVLMGKPLWLWLVFLAIVVVLLALDLGVLHRKEREIGVSESLWLSAGYIGIACAFGTWVWWQLGSEAGLNFFTGFAVEKSLSLDNVFVISLIFTYFAIPRLYQHRVLFWGILGVIVLRAIMIGLGAALVSEFHWVLYIFGAFLVFTGIKMLFVSSDGHDIGENPLLRFLRRHMRVTPELHGKSFLVRLPDPKTGKLRLWATPLFLTLMLVEFADLIFAVDSVPAIFAITTDPFIVYTSNIFAILGLRALYFALAAMVHRFQYLKYALSLVLIFIGGKIFYNQFFGKMDPAISLGVTFGLLVGGVVVSLVLTARKERAFG
ncbi:tellurite resistance protein TerC [Dongia mobilis]|uniref:Tellurite resistance protein TerC n=1 Tax=Dongia mobilis TaxID=578943 RepID=A0A4R6WJK6_9PROT|nr:TerC family protein [Dongia mobilis]TDQ80555.1 tellurite resistance protein TerC [Dongia mobilis]